ncbi:hypothetical protein BV25DRAFT_1902420 [Artomyces pyxidatus]|uniref:Uncharacterized protein n=1 Tax=Artomyces pyxidatus TaxID=48021 RepID=A0ACB8SPA9_9AGAM|nr:hypothetical protein BV25DRAFT_1902420 [Artomyces pyxidatus]
MSLQNPLSSNAHSPTYSSTASVEQAHQTGISANQHPLPDKGKSSGISAVDKPEVHVNGAPVRPALRQSKSFGANGPDDAAWGSNFWVTLVDPQTQVSFFACPATGEVSWDPPVGHFVLPPNENGEWWEIGDESRGGIPYYYHTKTGETVWDKPDGFVIPLTVLQNTALGRRLSKSFSTSDASPTQETRPRSSTRERRATDSPQRQSQGSRTSPGRSPVQASKKNQQTIRRSFSSDPYQSLGHGAPPHGLPQNGRAWSHGPSTSASTHLPPIPGSPYVTEGSAPPSPTSRKSVSALSLARTSSSHSSRGRGKDRSQENGSMTQTRSSHNTANGRMQRLDVNGSSSSSKLSQQKSTTAYVPTRSPPQSLHAAVELLAQSQSHTPPRSPVSPSIRKASTESGYASQLEKEPEAAKPERLPPPARPVPSTPKGPRVGGREIGEPVLNTEATLNLSPVKSRAAGKPIRVDPPPKTPIPTATLSTGMYPILPHDLASDIQQFVESDFARQYFSTHKTGFIFRRKIPMAQMMTWQKGPLASPLLNLTRTLHKDAIKTFKVIQRLMGDRERETRSGARLQVEHTTSTVPQLTSSTSSLPSGSFGLLEEERWLLGEGLTHGELRDEIYCQLMKQLTGNPTTESVFKGWQLLCVLLVTFPPSKNFETYLESFLKQRTSQTEGRVDIMAKHCLKRLSVIAKKGPRGKPPTVAEIETASDAAFNPSTFGESLDAIYRLQERNYPQQKTPIILPFLADGILALGGTKAEGIFRVPGDGDSVSELKLRIDKGYYNLEGVDDPHVLASLLKLWLRELCDPLVPEEMYNDCISYANDADACVGVVERLPTINRRVVLFIISFLQLFLDERVLAATKMTSANLALVMAPNLLRCSSDSMAVVFTNAQYEQTFVHNLLLHLQCNQVDPEYVPSHGLGAVATSPLPRTSKSRTRRNHG